MPDSGKLFLVPTPIGNLGDMTLRGLEVLRNADFILAEDTRTSGVLLKHFEISKPLQAYHAHNEHQQIQHWLEKIREGKQIALISDAGTPAISDPGFLLARACIRENLPLEVLPGATAFVPALVLSGLPAHQFVFMGFLPQKKGRQTALKQMALESRTMILYESPYRIVKLLGELGEYLGAQRLVSVSRELSKKFEETVRGSITEVQAHFKQKEPKGEFVVVIGGIEEDDDETTE